jgi:hypothetical protein
MKAAIKGCSPGTSQHARPNEVQPVPGRKMPE